MDIRLHAALHIQRATGAPLGQWMIRLPWGREMDIAHQIVDFCRQVEAPAEIWMALCLQSHHQWLGCVECVRWGRRAVCWGNPACHGYWNGCGCQSCVQQEKRAGAASQCYVTTLGLWDALGQRQRFLREAFALHLTEECALKVL